MSLRAILSLQKGYPCASIRPASAGSRSIIINQQANLWPGRFWRLWRRMTAQSGQRRLIQSQSPRIQVLIQSKAEPLFQIDPIKPRRVADCPADCMGDYRLVRDHLSQGAKFPHDKVAEFLSRHFGFQSSHPLLARAA
jgi:hypothetical protein